MLSVLFTSLLVFASRVSLTPLAEAAITDQNRESKIGSNNRNDESHDANKINNDKKCNKT